MVPRLASFLCALTVCGAFVLVYAPPVGGVILAQSTGSPVRRSGSGLRTSGAAPATKGAAVPSARSPATPPPVTAPTAPSETPPSVGSPAANPAPSTEDLPLPQRIRAFIRVNALWILVALFCTLAAALTWLFLGMKGRKTDASLRSLGFEGGGDRMEEKRSHRYSSTKIQKSDITAGLSAKVTTMQVETDREYALVVDEEALKPPPLPEEARPDSGHGGGEAGRIRSLIDAGKYLPAFQAYAKQIAANPKEAFPDEVEYALGEGLMRANDLENAIRVLERYVSKRRGRPMNPLAFFNLGYMHFMRRSLQRSRRFFQLFVSTEKNPEYVERARRILAKIESASPSK